MITLWADVPLEAMDAVDIYTYLYIAAHTAHQTGETSQLLKETV